MSLAFRVHVLLYGAVEVSFPLINVPGARLLQLEPAAYSVVKIFDAVDPDDLVCTQVIEHMQGPLGRELSQELRRPNRVIGDGLVYVVAHGGFALQEKEG